MMMCPRTFRQIHGLIDSEHAELSIVGESDSNSMVTPSIVWS